MAEGSAPETNREAREQLVGRLQRLWQQNPGEYWKAFKASGLQAKDVWPDAYEYVPTPKLDSVPKKQPGKAAKG